MNREQFISASSQIRVLEKRLIGRALYERLIDAKDIEEVFRFLQETDYQEAINRLNRPEEYEQVLGDTLWKSFKKVRSICPDERVVQLLALKYEYHNIKVLLKAHIRGLDYSRMYIHLGELDIEKLKEEFDSGDRREVHPPYFEVVDTVMDDYAELKDPQRIDIIVDRFYFKHMLRLAKEIDSELILHYVEDLIDYTNMRTLFRAKDSDLGVEMLDVILIEGGNLSLSEIRDLYFENPDQVIGRHKLNRISKTLYRGIESYIETDHLSLFEKGMDDYLMDVIREAKRITYGPEVPFAYLLAKETEIKNLRMIMVSKLNRIDSNSIRERIREIYV